MRLPSSPVRSVTRAAADPALSCRRDERVSLLRLAPSAALSLTPHPPAGRSKRLKEMADLVHRVEEHETEIFKLHLDEQQTRLPVRSALSPSRCDSQRQS